MKPEHSICRVCGIGICRLGDRERWRHYDGLQLGHQPEPMDAKVAAEIREARRRD